MAKPKGHEAWSLPDARDLKEPERYKAVVAFLGECGPDTRRAVVRWVIASELDEARVSYRDASDDGEVYRAALVKRAGVSLKRTAEDVDAHLHGLELVRRMVTLAVGVVGSVETAGRALDAALGALRDVAGPWRDARAGAEYGHGIASLDGDEARVARLRQEAQRIHDQWTAKASAKKA